MDFYTRYPLSKFTLFIFGNTRFAIVWFFLRLYVGYIWIEAGWEKFQNPAWVGAHAGTAVAGFLNNALTKTSGAHPDVMGFYAWFISHVALPHAQLFSYIVTYGELCVGLGLITGMLTGTAAFFGMTMNFNYLFSGTTSINPLLILIQIFLVLAWRTAGYVGFDRWFLPKLRDWCAVYFRRM